MRCTSCQFENREGRRFCSNCGASLLVCPKCGFQNEPDDRFCGGCGNSLAPQAGPLPAEESSPQALVSEKLRSAERRQLTVMFCDLAKSTELSARLDPEDLREVIRGYQATCQEVVNRFGGYIAQYLGDGILVYFGYPVAHEEDAQRACWAGLGILEAISKLELPAELAEDIPLSVRIGIHTGPVVVSELGQAGRGEWLALGETPNIAARLQGLAELDTLVISESTHRLVRGQFDSEPLGPANLKGISEPLDLHRLLRTSQESLQRRRSQESQSLVGRSEELSILSEAWMEAREGRGSVVELSGGAGAGKSRLIRAFENHSLHEPARRLWCNCSPLYQSTPFFPVLQLLNGVLDLSEDSDEAKTESLLASLTDFEDPVGMATLLAKPLGIQLPEEAFPALPLTLQREREETLSAIVEVILRTARGRPLLLIFEDVHWADPSSLSVLQRLIQRAPEAPFLLLVTHRLEFEPSWESSRVREVRLDPLSPSDCELLIRGAAGDRDLPPEVVREIVKKTDGIPLFVEQLTRDLLESGQVREAGGHFEVSGNLLRLSIPSTIQDSLTARLDRLGEAKSVAQLGATIGRAFSHELLAKVSQIPDDILLERLGSLVEADLLQRSGLGLGANYSFTHALVQDTAYASLLRRTRQRYHERIVEVLPESFPDMIRSRPELMAYHSQAAGLYAEAVSYWRQASQLSFSQGSTQEAISHLRASLAIIDRLPEDEERGKLEIGLQNSLGGALQLTYGFGSPGTREAYSRTRELCHRWKEPSQHFQALRGLFLVHASRAQTDQAWEVLNELTEMAEQAQIRPLLHDAYRSRGYILMTMGRFQEAIQFLDRSIELFQAADFDIKVHHRLGTDPLVAALLWRALSRSWLGYPDQSLEDINAAIRRVNETGRPVLLATSLAWISYCHVLWDEVGLVLETSQRSKEIATEHGLPAWQALGGLAWGWGTTMEGQHDAGILEIEQSIERYRATGTLSPLSLFLTLLAQAHLRAGNAEQGLSTVEEALLHIEQTNERFCQAELHRLKAEFLKLRSAPIEEIAAELSKGLLVAQEQESKLWELRCRISQLRQDPNPLARQSSREALEETVAWFREGRQTRLVQTAVRMLFESSF